MSLPDFTPTLGRGALDDMADVRELTGNTPDTQTHTRTMAFLATQRNEARHLLG